MRFSFLACTHVLSHTQGRIHFTLNFEFETVAFYDHFSLLPFFLSTVNLKVSLLRKFVIDGKKDVLIVWHI